MTISRNQVVALGAFIVLLYTWVLLPDALLSRSFTTLMVREDYGVVEMLGALSLLAASGLFLVCFLRARSRGSTRVKQLFFLGLAVALFIGAGEEMSWGQRFLGVDTPERINTENYQGELNFHNLDDFGEWAIWRVFEIFTLLFAVALPLAAWWNPRARAVLSRYVPIIPLTFSGLFLFTELMNALAAFVYPGSWEGEIAEGIPPNDVLYPGGIWEGAGTTETIFSLLYAVVGFDLLRSRVSTLGGGERSERMTGDGTAPFRAAAVVFALLGALFLLGSWDRLYDTLDLPQAQPALGSQIGGLALLGLAVLSWSGASNLALRRPVVIAGVLFYLGSALMIASWLIFRGKADLGIGDGGVVVLIVAAAAFALLGALLLVSPVAGGRETENSAPRSTPPTAQAHRHHLPGVSSPTAPGPWR